MKLECASDNKTQSQQLSKDTDALGFAEACVAIKLA